MRAVSGPKVVGRVVAGAVEDAVEVEVVGGAAALLQIVQAAMAAAHRERNRPRCAQSGIAPTSKSKQF
ncbi:MAG: hypothetical protein QOH22_1132 [Gemmatimonadaceae bacterium]|nr:hypothetical protein [Gemmatimonadaceae bacterium]